MTSTANLTTSYVLMKELDQVSAQAELSHIPVSTITRLNDGTTLHLDEKYRSIHMMRMIDLEKRLEYNWTISKSASLNQNLISKSASSSASSAVDSTRVSRWYRPKDHWLFFGL